MKFANGLVVGGGVSFSSPILSVIDSDGVFTEVNKYWIISTSIPSPYPYEDITDAVEDRFSSLPHIYFSNSETVRYFALAGSRVDDPEYADFIVADYNVDGSYTYSGIAIPSNNVGTALIPIVHTDGDVSIAWGKIPAVGSSISSNFALVSCSGFYNQVIESEPSRIVITPSPAYVEGTGFGTGVKISADILYSPTGSVHYGNIYGLVDFPLPDGISYSALYGWYFTDDSLDSVTLTLSFENLTSSVRIIKGVAPTPPYNPGGTSGPSGGGGTFGKDEISDSIDFPIGSVDPNTSNAGLFTKYVMTAAQMSQLGEYFWSTDFVDSVERELITKMYGNPSDTIISIMALPVDPRDFGIASGSGHIFFGSVDSGIPSNGILSNTAVNINWGSIQVDEYYGSFLDYAPHTKIELYLPWSTGFVSIDPNDVVGGSISVSSNLEFDKGTCTHIVSGKNGVIGTYDGVFGKQIPISALDTGGKYLTAIMGAVGATIAGTIAVGGAALAGAATATTAANAAAGTGIATMSQSSYAMGAAAQKALIAAAPTTAEYMGIYAGQALPVFAGTSLAAFRTPSHVMRNGNFTGNTAGMNVQYPFIRVSRPTQSVPANYGNYVGYPSNIYSTLGNLRGYTEVAAIHLEGFSATVDEKNEISELLKGGVIL